MNIKEEISNFKSMVNSYKLTSLIITANNIGIFNKLSEAPKNLEQIAKEIEIPSDRIEPLLNGLVFNKMIDKNENGYCLTEYKDVLLKDSKFNQTGYIDFAQTVMEKYNSLEKAIKDNNFSFNNFKDLTEEQAENFMKGMQANAVPQAEYITSKYNFENHNILDIGAGAGTYLITVSKEYKSVKGKMIDLPQVSKIQNRNIQKEHLQDRLISIACDYNYNFPQEHYDDVFLFAVIHQEPKENVRKLLENIKTKWKIIFNKFFLK